MAKRMQNDTRRAGKADIGKLAHDLLCRDAAEMYFDVLRMRVSEFKNSELYNTTQGTGRRLR